jgi:hypothetical protein
MDRAKAMGYDTKVYRGTGSDERVAKKSTGHEHGVEGVSTTFDPRYASMHGNNVMPLLAKSGNVEDYFDLINNFENKTGRSFSDASERLFTDAVKGEGVRASALYDPNAGLDIRYLYPEDLRSVNAAFDPAHAKSADLLKAKGGPVHMDEGGLNVRASGDYGNFDSEGSSGSHYNFSTDVDILNKYGFGVTKEGQVFKLPERSYTYEDGYTETVPARKIKRDDISELRARYTTDDGVQYGVGRQPLAKGWSGYRTDPRTQATVGFNVSPQYKNLSVYRSDPRSQSSVGVNVSPYYKGVSYTKNFAEGGAVETDDFDYDEMYEFKKDEPAFAEGGEVDYDAMYEFR